MMGEDAKHVIMDVDGNFWEENVKGLWHSASIVGPDLTFTALVSRHGPIRIFVELVPR